MSKHRREGIERFGTKATVSIDGLQEKESRQIKLEMIALGNISPSPYQARKDFGDMEELIEDVRANGILQPLVVRPTGPGSYELVAGERRLIAAREAGLQAVPAMIRQMDDRTARILGLSENLKRQDLNAYELAAATIELATELSGLERARVRQEVSHGRAPSQEVAEAMEEALRLMDRQLSLQSFRRHYAPLLSLPNHLIDAINRGESYVAIKALNKATREQQEEWLPMVVSREWDTARSKRHWQERRGNRGLQKSRQTGGLRSGIP